jgi:hypothetical protein
MQKWVASIGNENRGQLFALTRVLPNARLFGLPLYAALLPAGFILVANCELLRADNPGLHEQF